MIGRGIGAPFRGEDLKIGRAYITDCRAGCKAGLRFGSAEATASCAHRAPSPAGSMLDPGGLGLQFGRVS
jgi:hypothetical protein